MYRLPAIGAMFGLALALALSGCSSSGGLAPATTASASSKWIDGGGFLYHRPHYALTAEQPTGRVEPDIFVTYGGGPALVKPKVYVVFWGYKKYGDPDGMAKLLIAYTKAMGGSSHNNIYTQYYQIVQSQKAYITNHPKQFGGSWEDDSAIPKKPSDSQVASEALKAAAHFGYDPNGMYIVATARGHSAVGFGSHWCSYHSTASGSGNIVPYANLPYIPDAGHPCGANYIKPPAGESAKDEGVTIMAGHEYGEMATDPQPFTGWNGVQGEIADACAFVNIKNDPFGNVRYTSQPMLSDQTESCVHSYP